MRKASSQLETAPLAATPPARSATLQLRRSRPINCDANVKCGKPLAEAEDEQGQPEAEEE